MLRGLRPLRRQSSNLPRVLWTRTATWSLTRRPIQEAEWIHRTLIFAYTPVEDPAVYAKVWDGFLKHLEKTTGKRVQFFPVQSNAAQIEAMRAGRLHVAGFNTRRHAARRQLRGLRAVHADGARKDGTYGYEMEIITYPGLGHRQGRRPQGQEGGLHGRDLQFQASRRRRLSCATSSSSRPARTTSPSSPANTTIRSSASPTRTIPRLRSPTRSEAHDRARRAQGRSGEVTIFASESFPSPAYGTVYNLKPELAEEDRGGFFTFPWEGSALLNEFKNNDPPVDNFLPITYKQHWQIVRDIDTGDERLLRLQVGGDVRKCCAISDLTKRYRTGDEALRGVIVRGRRRARSSA